MYAAPRMPDSATGQWPLLKRIIKQGWEYRSLVVLMLLTTATVTALTGYQGKLFKDLIEALTAVQHGGGSDSSAAITAVQRVAVVMLALALPLGVAWCILCYQGIPSAGSSGL